MTFSFFTAAGTPLFLRSDAEQATWTVEEYTLQLLFPYDPEKAVERGQRVGFQYDGVWQLFEIRKVKTYEPDHYQEITAEHICVSELTDDHFYQSQITNKTAGEVVTTLLTGTLWTIGTNTSSGTQSADLGTGSVWQDLQTVQANWNVYITPRVTVDSTGITGRYLDIAPAQGVWRGVRLSVDKNADELGVTIDDTELATALYGYGAGVDDGAGGTKPLTFENVEWSATADHPAKPFGQKYIEDPNATLTYGRNGRARFGYYQNASIKDAQTLLEYTWESLKQAKQPIINIDCQVRDLYRMGYADQPIQLHDLAMVEVSPIGEKYQLEITRLQIDLLDPTATRPTIGKYIPNIVYINREVAKKSGGGGGGGRGKSASENERIEFETAIEANSQQIQLRATQYDLNQTNNTVALAQTQINQTATGITSLATGTGAQLNPDGSLVVDAYGNPVFTTNGAGLYSKITQNAQQILLRVVKGDVATQLAVEAENVTITGGNLIVDGYATVQGLNALSADIHNLTTGVTTATRLGAQTISATSALWLGGTQASWHSIGIVGISAGMFLGQADVNLGHYHTLSESGGVVTLGAATTEGPQTFNIAATAFYQNAVAAAYQRGVQDGSGTITVDGISVSKSGNPTWSGSTLYQNIYAYAYHLDGDTQEILKSITTPINVTSIYTDGVNSVTLSEGWNSSATYTVTATNGRSHSTTITGLALNNTYTDQTTSHLMGVFGIYADNGSTPVTSKSLDLQSVVSGISVSTIRATTTATIYNDSSGSVSVRFYIKLSNGNTYQPYVEVPYRTID